ncbi:hypothetical protein EJB05_01291 [Eragrostis curvula]|uniref:Cathepsin propeptide inhibitor domain-containing protein n=1 Tax=Eragrostis curvula TaxID=38414 RepID=A0A5J9WRL5_9POAL|nr:hypothetical protein EJB05_01291 [Eragrostis curvula]
MSSRAAAADIQSFARRFPQRVLSAHAAPTAAWTRPPLSCLGAGSPLRRLLRRGLATVTEDNPPGCEHMPWSDPEAPVPGFDYDDKDLASEEAMWAMYERWCAYHEVQRSRDDMLRRFGLFKERARRIHEFNQSGASFTKGLNIFGDQTAEERAKKLRGGLCRD